MNKYDRILKTVCEGEEFEDMPEEEIDGDDLGVEMIPDEDTVYIGSLVRVVDASSFTAEELGLDDEQFEEFKAKAEAGDSAIVFNENDEDENIVDIVFEDGFEAFNIPKIALTHYEEEDEDEETEEIPTEESFDDEEIQ